MESEKRLGNPCTNLAMVFKHLHYILCTFSPFLRLFCTVCTVHLSTTSNRQFKICFIPFSFLFLCQKKVEQCVGWNRGWGKEGTKCALIFRDCRRVSLASSYYTIRRMEIEKTKSMREMEGRTYFLFLKKKPLECATFMRRKYVSRKFTYILSGGKLFYKNKVGFCSSSFSPITGPFSCISNSLSLSRKHCLVLYPPPSKKMVAKIMESCGKKRY